MKFANICLVLLFVLAISCSQQTQPINEKSNQVRNVEILKNNNLSGIRAEDVKYFENSAGFLAQPDKEGVYPAVVMIHEWWGLNDNIKEMAKQLAAEGYVVLAVDLFSGKVAKDANEARELITPINKNPLESVKNMKAAVEFLKILRT